MISELAKQNLGESQFKIHQTDRLLYPEKHLKQTKLPIGKKKNCVVCTDFKKGKRVCTSFICEHCNVALCLGQCWENYHTKKVL